MAQKTKESKVFGKLKFHRAKGEYSASINHRGTDITVSFILLGGDPIEDLLTFAEKIWKGRAKHFKTFREYAVANLLEDLNGILDCGQNDPPKITSTQLRKNLSMPFSIDFYLDTDEHHAAWFQMAGGSDPLLDECCVGVVFDEHGNPTEGEAILLC